MGCNFYTLKGQHIGKRSAAGLYCWDCSRTLCMLGEQEVHRGRSGWFEKCPSCGNGPVKETLENGAAGRELGFNKSKPTRKKGVASCASFTWATEEAGLKVRKVKDEYGRKYTWAEFLEVLEECPIRYKLIGVDFS